MAAVRADRVDAKMRCQVVAARWVALVLAVALPARAYDGWTRPTLLESIPQAAAVGLITLDAWQTFTRHDRLDNQPGWEANPILGSRPSKPKIVLLGGLAPALLTTAIWYALPSAIRWWVPALVIPIEGTQVYINFSLGDRLW